MVIRLEEERPTHFGPVETVEIDGSEDPVNRTVELLPAVRVRGRLDDSVPRPVKNGRVKVETINAGLSWDEINWFSWAEVNEDGTFVIEEWPANQPIQLIALCDGFIAKSGEKPAMVKPERAVEGRLRPQVFMKPGEAELVVEMTPLIACNIQVVNGFGKPVQGADIVSAPNVSWWNGGSQIYGWPLVSSTQLLLPGKYERLDGEGIHAQPFKGTTDEDGRLTLGLPVGRESLWAVSKRYQLPINAGRRMHGLEIAADKPVNATLVLQPRGLDVLGDWEDLCGFVFG